ncbi:MAG: hypothetical protein JW809_14865 [Pirellulales bacterium]|nr:hypothetical protein [Pirellulales bacterium]
MNAPYVIAGTSTAAWALAQAAAKTDVVDGWEGAVNFTATAAVITIAVTLSLKLGPLMLGKYHGLVEKVGKALDRNNRALRANARSNRALAAAIDRLGERVGPASPSPEAAAPRDAISTGGA